MIDYIEFDPVPCNEDCEQLGPRYDGDRARKQAQAFKHQLIRQFGEPPEGARISVVSKPHDFGNYLQVRVKYDDNYDGAREYAYNVEDNLPENWDEQAKQELSQ